MNNFKEIREKYKGKFPPSLVAAAVKIALDMGGNMTGAYKKIEAMKRGLGDDPIVKDALRQANEETVKEGKKLSPAQQEKLVDLFNQLMDVKHGGPEYKKIKKQIELVQMRREEVEEGKKNSAQNEKILRTIGAAQNMDQAIQMVMKKYNADEDKAKKLVHRAVKSAFYG